MPIKELKPTSPGRRFTKVIDTSILTKKKPQKSLLRPLKKKAGRDKTGQISIRHRGGGAKRLYRLVDFKQTRYDLPAKIVAIEYDPNRRAFIALIEYPDKTKSYILAPQGLKVGDEIISSEKTEIKVGNRMKLKNIPTGMPIYNIELSPGKGGQIVRGAGNSATIIAKEGKYAHLRLPSGEIRKVLLESAASIGQVSNPLVSSIKIGKAGRVRWKGIRPTVRGKAMHPAAHPHGGGEGVSPIGLKYPKTAWGKPAIGVRTRKKKKYSDKLIIKRRK